MGIEIADVNLDITREPFLRPFGFKGNAFHEKWICHVDLTGTSGVRARGQGGLAVLWSDAHVFCEHTEVGGNVIMVNLLEYALQLVKGKTFTTPLDLLAGILEDVHAYGCHITNRPDLSRTFTQNSLVALDNAAWILYAREQHTENFDQLLPAPYRSALNSHHDSVAGVPLLSYQSSPEEILAMVQQGYFFLKIKIGAPGDSQQMLTADRRRLAQIHDLVKNHHTPHTADGRIKYYLDANGRYTDKDDILRLLESADAAGMLKHTLLLEEPFPNDCAHDVGDLPLLVAADESLHSVADVTLKAQQGYRCLALKPAGKTLSVAVQMAREAAAHHMASFVADSACTPILVEWNKIVAARLPSLPQLSYSALESNGHQNYRNWQTLLDQHPCPQAPWIQPQNGVYHLNEDFYRHSGGIFAH